MIFIPTRLGPEERIVGSARTMIINRRACRIKNRIHCLPRLWAVCSRREIRMYVNVIIATLRPKLVFIITKHAVMWFHRIFKLKQVQSKQGPSTCTTCYMCSSFPEHKLLYYHKIFRFCGFAEYSNFLNSKEVQHRTGFFSFVIFHL